MKKQALPIEHSLFSFDCCDGDEDHMVFYDCEVVTPFGPYEVGAKLDQVDLIYCESRIEVYPEIEEKGEHIPEWVGTLSLQVNP